MLGLKLVHVSKMVDNYLFILTNMHADGLVT